MINRIASVVFWLGAALVGGALAIRFAIPEQEQYAPYLAWAGLACMLLYTVSQWREIGGAMSKRQARYGALSASSVLIVLGILVAVNYIGRRQNVRWDLTAAQQFSLSDQTRNVLQGLEGPLEIMAFAPDTDFQRFRDVLEGYEYESSQVTAEYVDPDRRPTVAQQYAIEQYGTVLVSYQGRSERTVSLTEQDITNAIIKVVSGETRTVYFTQGHGEKDPESNERDGYSSVAEALRRENYAVDTVVLAQEGRVPENASVVVVAGPRQDFLQPEVDALATYLGNAGKVLLLLDPPQSADEPPMANLLQLAQSWNIELSNDLVVDASGMGRILGTDASVPVAANYPDHAITQRFGFITAYPLARSVRPIPGGANGRVAAPFIESSPRSWAEADMKALLADGELSLDEASGDVAGPVPLGTAVSAPAAKPAPAEGTEADPDAPAPESRIAVVGDADFAANATLGIQGNRDMFLNIVGWLSQQENLIAIRPRAPEDRRITLTATQQNNILWLSIVIVPAIVFGTGVYTWWRRR
ncbi:MAG: GldG family protein [Vicinamibacterales bacterium]